MIKNILFAALMTLPMVSQAYSEDVSSRPDDFYTEVINWCDSNKVMAQDSRGALYVIADCSEQNLVCRTYQLHKFNRTLFTAACAQK